MAKPSYVANYIPQLIEEGHTATSALDHLREQGHSIASQTFYRLWGETVDHLSKVSRVSAAPLNRRPIADEIGIATRPRARGFLYNVEIAVHDPLTGEVSFHTWGARSSEAISFGKALRLATEDFEASKEGGRDTPSGRALGGFVSSVLQLVGPEDTVGLE